MEARGWEDCSDIIDGTYRTGEGEDSEAAEISRDAKVASAFAGSLLTREASRAAFEERGRSMVCGDVVEEVGPAFSRLFEA